MASALDDFTSGAHDVTITTGLDLTYRGGSMLGGARWTQLIVAQNPRHQPAHLDTGSGFFTVSAGAEQYLRVELGYGWNALVGGGLPIGEPMDLASLGQAIRTNFHSADRVVNFNVVAFSIGGWSSHGVTLSEGTTPFSHDFELGAFTSNGTPADFSQLTDLVFVFQTFADFVISSIEMV